MGLPGKALVPMSHIRYHVPTNTAYCWETPRKAWWPGIHTVLFPRVYARYKSINVGEDTDYYFDNFADRLHFWDNRKFAHHFLYLCWGDSAVTSQLRERFLGQYAGEQWAGRWCRGVNQPGGMTNEQVGYFRTILRDEYGINVDGA